MTNPIRPSGPAPLGDSSSLHALDALDSAQPGAASRGADGVGSSAGSQAAGNVDAPATLASNAVHHPSTTAPTGHVQSPAAALLERLQAGQLTREEAVTALVSEALTNHGAARLSGVHREELAAVLRTALLDDPALGKLLR